MEFDEEGREGWGCDGVGEGEKRVCLRRRRWAVNRHHISRRCSCGYRRAPKLCWRWTHLPYRAATVVCVCDFSEPLAAMVR